MHFSVLLLVIEKYFYFDYSIFRVKCIVFRNDIDVSDNFDHN
jgi:hypothetical protein